MGTLFLLRAQEALKRYLAGKKASDLVLATNNQFNREVTGQSNGYKIARFIAKKAAAVFAGFGRASTLAGLTLPTEQVNSTLGSNATEIVAANNLSRDFTISHTDVSPEVLVKLQADEQKFEQEFYADSKNTVPNLRIPAQEAFEQQLNRVSEMASNELGLRASFDENTGVTFAHHADKVEALQNATQSPASERIRTFSYNAAPESRRINYYTAADATSRDITPAAPANIPRAPVPVAA